MGMINLRKIEKANRSRKHSTKSSGATEAAEMAGHVGVYRMKVDGGGKCKTGERDDT